MRSFYLASSLLLIASGQMLNAQSGNDLSGRVRGLNNNILRLHGAAQGASRQVYEGMRLEVEAAIQERATALETLIRQDPDEALRLGFSPDLVTALGELFPQVAGSLEKYGDWEGSAEYWVLDDASLKSSQSVVKMTVGQETLDVHFGAADVPSGLKCGSILKVSGMKVNGHVAAASGSITGSTQRAAGTTPTLSPDSTGGGCSTTGTQNIAVILLNFPGVPSPITTTQAYNVFFGTSGRSVNGYWQDASHGLASATGNVFGPYTLSTAYTCDQYSQIGAEALTLADPDVYFPGYNHIFYIFPLPSGCTYGGISTIGCTLQSSADGSFTASNSWLIANYLSPNDQGVELAVHEGGHGLTLSHARSRGFAPLALGALGAGGTITEYGDNFDPMGYYNLGHYGAQHKVQLGWLNPSNVLTVQSSGTYSVAPLGIQTSATQALQVQRGTGNPDWLWIEYHQPVGNYESQLSSQIYSGATIRYLDSLTGAGYTNLLDFTPTDGSWMDPALAAGQSWADPYTNVSLSINSATSSALTVGVNYGVTPCTPGTPSLAASPSNPSVAAGSAANYTVTITNKDSATCAPSVFSMSSGQPSGWPTSMSSSSVSLSPGQSVSVTVTKTVPVGTSPGTYTIPFGASDATMSSSTSAYCSVLAPAPPLAATLSVPATSYKAKSSVPMTVTVLSGSAPAVGASVVFTLIRTGGSTSTQTATTNGSGIATWNDKIMTSGSYSVSAKVTLSTQNVTTKTVTFQVQ